MIFQTRRPGKNAQHVTCPETLLLGGLLYSKVPYPSEADVPWKFRSTSEWHLGVKRIFSYREFLNFNDKWECLSQVADAGGPALVRGSSGLIAHGGATKGGKGEDTLRASAVAGFQFAMACLFVFGALRKW